MLSLLKKKLAGSQFSSLDACVFVWGRGVLPLLRGILINFITLSFSKKPILIGRGVSLHHYSKFKFGRNCYIGDYSYLNFLSTHGVEFGDHVTVREYTWLQLTSSLNNPGTSIKIGSHTYIGPRCNLGAAAPLLIGQRCQVGAGVSFIAENHSFEAGEKIFDQGVIRKGITIGDDCWIGNGVIILDGVTIGNGVVIGAGSVVTKSIPDYAVVVGVPAKILKFRTQ